MNKRVSEIVRQQENPERERIIIAQRILSLEGDGPGQISLRRETGGWGSAYTDIKDTAAGRMINSRHGEVQLDVRALRAILTMHRRYGQLRVSSIAGGLHSGTCHYGGRAIDISQIGGVWVRDMSNARIREINSFMRTLGTSRIIDRNWDPVGHRDHFHLEWS